MLKRILQHVFDNVNGINMIALFDRDGFVIEKIDYENIAEEISAEFSSMLRYFSKISSVFAVTEMQYFMFEGDKKKFFIKKLNHDYYIVVSMSNTSITGKLKFALDMVYDDLLKEL
ncbi:MAG: roadblock/LC7 domain-containing protein [Deferribacterales bacterium]